LEAASAISYLLPLHQDHLRIQVAKNIGSFYKQQKQHDVSYNEIGKRRRENHGGYKGKTETK
jgi:hypothetical protein